MHFIVLIGAGYFALFLIPASIRTPWIFLTVWGICVAATAFAFLRHTLRAATSDPLAHMFDRAFLDVCAVICAMSFGAWLLRTVATRREWEGYHHWVVLLLGCAAIPGILHWRFVH